MVFLLIPFSSTDTQGLEGMFARIKSFATNVTEWARQMKHKIFRTPKKIVWIQINLQTCCLMEFSLMMSRKNSRFLLSIPTQTPTICQMDCQMDYSLRKSKTSHNFDPCRQQIKNGSLYCCNSSILLVPVQNFFSHFHWLKIIYYK